MALRSLQMMRISRCICRNWSSSTVSPVVRKNSLGLKSKQEDKTHNNLISLDDPDTFGTLSGRIKIDKLVPEDDGDIKEEQLIQFRPLESQKLTTKQYADIIKQYLKHKRLKEAIDVLEVRMLTEDRVKPENYIYNILIGACADFGYTKKAFKLFNDMKRRALKPTGDTYTCLFEACANSPWISDGLKNALHLRNLMIEKGIEPNLTNYNAMIKAFGRCGDLNTAFQIVDEMHSKKIKIRVHTFNHLLHACISDKDTGLRHALVVWRKMLKMKEKPNIYTFNLMLRCVKECNLGSKEDTEELIATLQSEMPMSFKRVQFMSKETNAAISALDSNAQLLISSPDRSISDIAEQNDITKEQNKESIKDQEANNQLAITENSNNTTMQLVQNFVKLKGTKDSTRTQPTIPNFLSRIIKMDQVLDLQEVHNPQDRFAIIGGQDDFLKEMEAFAVKPDIKTFTQMLPLIEETQEAENKLLEAINSLQVRTDIDFYNMLIKKRCLRSDYEGALEVKELIRKEAELRKKRYSMNKKKQIKVDIMTYGALAMACKTKESAVQLLAEMQEKQIKVNIEILGTLLRNGTAQNKFVYVFYIMDLVKKDSLKPNNIFLKHLEAFSDKCANFIEQNKKNRHGGAEIFKKSYDKFLDVYVKWLQEVDVSEALNLEHPWKQFRENYPETMQNSNFKIEEPKRFYKRNRKFVPYIVKT